MTAVEHKEPADTPSFHSSPNPSLSSLSLIPLCLLLRQELMHAYIMGRGKARGAGSGRVGEGRGGGEGGLILTGNIQKEIQ